MEVRVGARHVVNLPDDPVHRAVRDDHDASRVEGDGEVRQQLQSGELDCDAGSNSYLWETAMQHICPSKRLGHQVFDEKVGFVLCVRVIEVGVKGS